MESLHVPLELKHSTFYLRLARQLPTLKLLWHDVILFLKFNPPLLPFHSENVYHNVCPLKVHFFSSLATDFD